MKTLTEKIVDRLEAEAKSWEHKTPQCEALFMAAKIVANEFAEQEKDMMCEFAFRFNHDAFNENYIKAEVEETFNTKEK